MNSLTERKKNVKNLLFIGKAINLRAAKYAEDLGVVKGALEPPSLSADVCRLPHVDPVMIGVRAIAQRLVLFVTTSFDESRDALSLPKFVNVALGLKRAEFESDIFPKAPDYSFDKFRADIIRLEGIVGTYINSKELGCMRLYRDEEVAHSLKRGSGGRAKRYRDHGYNGIGYAEIVKECDYAISVIDLSSRVCGYGSDRYKETIDRRRGDTVSLFRILSISE